MVFQLTDIYIYIIMLANVDMQAYYVTGHLLQL